MTRYFICCESCFENIAKKNTTAAKLWMDLCAMRLQFGEFLEILDTADIPELRALEVLGFIITTDMKNKIAIQVNGHFESEGEHCFCLLGGCHDDS